MKFRDYVRLKEVALSVPLGIKIPSTVFGAMPSVWTGSQSPDMPLKSGGYAGSNLDHMSFDLAIPYTQKEGRILSIRDKTNPIMIHLSDGTRIYIPYDGFKRIKGSPAVGKLLKVTFQRRPDDTSQDYSQVQSIECY